MATASITVGANTGGGLRKYVAAALDGLDELGIHYELTAMATNVEGDVQTILKGMPLRELMEPSGLPAIDARGDQGRAKAAAAHFGVPCVETVIAE